jgi:Na+/H+-dicarboxylate symporter
MNYLIYENITHVLHDVVSQLKLLLKRFLQLIIYLFLPVFIYLLFSNINEMILQNSPENLGSINSLSYSLLTFLDLHFMILLSALGITFVIWFITRDIWKN